MESRIQKSFPKKQGGVLRRGWRLFGRRRRLRQVTAIDLDGDVVRVVQVSAKGGRIEVTRSAGGECRLKEVAEEDAEERGRRIGAWLREQKIKTDAVVMGLPRAWVVLRTLRLPAGVERSEMAAMVQFQVGKDLPFAVEEAVIDFKVLQEMDGSGAGANAEGNGSGEGKPQKQVELLVAAVRKEVVRQYQALAAAGGFRLRHLGLRSFANVRCVEACGMVSPAESVVLVILRADEVIIDVVADHNLAFSRMAPIKEHIGHGGEGEEKAELAAVSSSEAFVRAVAVEVTRSLHSYEGQGRRRLARVLVIGTTGLEEPVAVALKDRLEMSCEVLDPATALGIEDASPSFASGAIAAFGLAMAASDPSGLPFDFLNPKRPRQPLMTRRTKMLAGIAAGCFLFVLLLGLRGKAIAERERVKSEAAQQLAAKRKNEDIFRRTQIQTKYVREWVEGKRDWLAHLAHLSAVLPEAERVYLSSISTSSRGDLRLSVRAASGETLADLEKRLRAVGYRVKPLAVTPSSDKFGYPFKSTVELEIAEDMEIEVAELEYPARPADDVP